MMACLVPVSMAAGEACGGLAVDSLIDLGRRCTTQSQVVRTKWLARQGGPYGFGLPPRRRIRRAGSTRQRELEPRQRPEAPTHQRIRRPSTGPDPPME